MDLKSYIAIIRGNIWVIISTVVITAVAATVFTFITTPMYRATATLRIATSATGTVAYSDYMYADRLMNTYIQLATSRPVLVELASKLTLVTLPEIDVIPVSNTELIKVTVVSTDPEVAYNSANVLAELLVNKGKELYSGTGKSAQEILGEQIAQTEKELAQAREEYETAVSATPDQTDRIAALNEAISLKEKTYATLLEQYDSARLRDVLRENLISVVEPAILPTIPFKPNKVMNIGLGIAAGLAGGIGLAFLVENLGSRLYSSRQIEAISEINIIGKIPPLPRKRLFNSGRDKGDNFRNIAFREAFRRLYVQCFMKNPLDPEGSPLKTLMITSAEPGEGKSTVTANLARMIALSGKRVIVVDCDLHIPKQHRINNLANKVGLTSVLFQKADLKSAIQNTQYPGMDVLTSGPLPNHPANLLGSPEMKSVVISLLLHYDTILLDTPALLALADSSFLLPIVDGVVFIARRNYIKEEALTEARRQLLESRSRIIGLVVNDAEKNGSSYYDR